MKKELIKKLNELNTKSEIEPGQWTTGASQYVSGWRSAIVAMRLWAGKFDEPEKEKATVPRNVALWIETAHREQLTLFQVLEDIECDYYYHRGDEPVYKWLFDCDKSSKNQMTFARAFSDGYKINEPLYRVILPNTSTTKFMLKRGEDGSVRIQKVTQNSMYSEHTKLTEAEIKQDFEWAWQFAKPVEESAN